ncbi:unnamed protein product [Acanthoscelides obtectus]|nr:unnamed protein product [Acanthoscelides obtectus]CAK1650498.1 Protein SPT2 homolog [Acanthoscelides obtectus]
MDFGQILHTAKKNEKTTSSNGVRYYSTKFEPPKKESKKPNTLSQNIKKFLARKEQEEKAKADEERRRKEELLALRSQDKKAVKRVNVMLKRTKSANQSVIDDAVDEDNTAVTLAGPMQPDEDDYGYVSHEASAFYNKMMEKYSKLPNKQTFDMTKKKVNMNLSSTKDRVKAALEREKEEAMMPHKRKRKHKCKKDDDDDEEGVSYDAPERGTKDDDVEAAPPPKPKPRPPAPPPMKFEDLLKIAEKKQHEPIIIEKKEKEAEKLLTKKQKREMEKEQEFLRRKQEREAERLRYGTEKPNRIAKSSDRNNTSDGDRPPQTKIPKIAEDRIPKATATSKSKSTAFGDAYKSQSDSFKKPYNSKLPPSPSTQKTVTSNTQKDLQKYVPSSKPIEASRSTSGLKNLTCDAKQKKPMTEPNKYGSENTKAARKYLPGDIRAKGPEDIRKLSEEEPKRKYLPGDIRAKGPEDLRKLSEEDGRPAKKYLPGDIRAKGPEAIRRLSDNRKLDVRKSEVKGVNRRPDDVKSSKSPEEMWSMKRPEEMKAAKRPGEVRPTKRLEEVKSRPFPSNDLKPKHFPPPDLRRFAPPKKKPVMANKRRILDDDGEEEYDSEMDDFIDDDEGPDNDYSKYISEIFGYDKSRYRDMDEDVDNMESSFAQQMREEVISTKIGIMEDLEDMKKEEEEKRRKLMMKKRGKL